MPAFKMACVPWGWKLKRWWRCASLPAGRSMFRCIALWLLSLLPHSPFPMEDVVLIHSISRFLLLLRDSGTRRWNIAYLLPWPPDSFCVTRLRQMGAELSPVCYHLSTAVQGQLRASCSPLTDCRMHLSSCLQGGGTLGLIPLCWSWASHTAYMRMLPPDRLHQDRTMQLLHGSANPPGSHGKGPAWPSLALCCCTLLTIYLFQHPPALLQCDCFSCLPVLPPVLFSCADADSLLAVSDTSYTASEYPLLHA